MQTFCQVALVFCCIQYVMYKDRYKDTMCVYKHLSRIPTFWCFICINVHVYAVVQTQNVSQSTSVFRGGVLGGGCIPGHHRWLASSGGAWPGEVGHRARPWRGLPLPGSSLLALLPEHCEANSFLHQTLPHALPSLEPANDRPTLPKPWAKVTLLSCKP